MLEHVKASELREAIIDGVNKCAADQREITEAYRKKAREERLAVRQVWADARKKLQALLDVKELEAK